jgi:hypothetical protein
LCSAFSAASSRGFTSTANLQKIQCGINRNNVAANVGRSVFVFGGWLWILLLQLPLAVPLLTLPKERVAKRIKKRNLSEPAGEFVSLPALSPVLLGTPQGQRLAVAFLCLLSLAKQRK